MKIPATGDRAEIDVLDIVVRLGVHSLLDLVKDRTIKHCSSVHVNHPSQLSHRDSGPVASRSPANPGSYSSIFHHNADERQLTVNTTIDHIADPALRLLDVVQHLTLIVGVLDDTTVLRRCRLRHVDTQDGAHAAVLAVQRHHFGQGPRRADVNVADKDVGRGRGAEDGVADCQVSAIAVEGIAVVQERWGGVSGVRPIRIVDKLHTVLFPSSYIPVMASRCIPTLCAISRGAVRISSACFSSRIRWCHHLPPPPAPASLSILPSSPSFPIHPAGRPLGIHRTTLTVIQPASSPQRLVLSQIANPDIRKLALGLLDEGVHDGVFVEAYNDDLGEARDGGEGGEGVPDHWLQVSYCPSLKDCWKVQLAMGREAPWEEPLRVQSMQRGNEAYFPSDGEQGLGACMLSVLGFLDKIM